MEDERKKMREKERRRERGGKLLIVWSGFKMSPEGGEFRQHIEG